MKHYSRYFLQSTLSVLFILLFPLSNILAQEKTVKFGKIDLADLQMKSYPKDTSSEAVILSDIADAYYRYSESSGLQVVFNRHRRIKILKKSGYDWASYQIPLGRYKGANKERIENLRGATYNLVNDQIVTDKLDKASIFDEKQTENLTYKKITLPNVKEGSVIEYTYSTVSDFDTSIPTWEFQKNIPVIWSEYKVQIPDFYHFKMIHQGYEPFFISTVKPVNISLDPTTTRYEGKEYRWVIKDAPAIQEEPFMTTLNDYNAKVEFEIAAIIPPGGLNSKYFSVTWEDFTKTLLEYENFGTQLKRGGFLKEKVNTIKAAEKEPVNQVFAAYQFIRTNMKWDGNSSIYTSNSLKKSFENKTGNCADINLMFIAMLKELGIEADPVVLSTRDHGRILPNYVLEKKFNYVVAWVKIGDNSVLLDATDPFLDFGKIPVRCLNGSGRLIHEANADWVPLSSNERITKTLILNFDLNNEGQMNGSLSISHLGYGGLYARKQIFTDSKAKYIESFRKKHPTWNISKFEIEKLEELSDPLVENITTSIQETASIAGDHIYLNPLLGEGEKENPFKTTERKFPVELATQIEENYIATFSIPEGYEIEELPKNIRLSLPNDGGKFSYFVSKTEEGKIAVSSKFLLKKPTFYAEEYSSLKEFYAQIVAKHAEQIVLKKK
ncbi:Transglutaminase-like superfamily protein [Pseudarcicella hirudinis]|uniref:Transglutaminase-like superfamily protein n=1 Tax=Pseudarcicella hirudinis TaxID=1079859 RepID=A0A1I5VZZ9_9BACT|nr:transglutaminase domain-containing protein [Pseudarcicella hirudinis]SFQ12576.1 Transglutaminase-like superfamily protein [Pseudarcicella hirudinis]